MRCFVRFVMFLIYVDIVFVLLVFMVPAEMVYRWTSGRKPNGYISCLWTLRRLFGRSNTNRRIGNLRL